MRQERPIHQYGTRTGRKAWEGRFRAPTTTNSPKQKDEEELSSSGSSFYGQFPTHGTGPRSQVGTRGSGAAERRPRSHTHKGRLCAANEGLTHAATTLLSGVTA